MSDKPSLYVVEKKEVVVLVVLFVLVTVLSFTLGVRYGESVGRKMAHEQELASKEVGGENVQGGAGTLGGEARKESGNPHEVLYHLAKNPDEAARIAMLPTARQAVAVAKVAQGLGAPRRVSSAPPPITPKVNGQGTAPASLDDPNLSMEEWARLRNEQVTARRKGR